MAIRRRFPPFFSFLSCLLLSEVEKERLTHNISKGHESKQKYPLEQLLTFPSLDHFHSYFLFSLLYRFCASCGLFLRPFLMSLEARVTELQDEANSLRTQVVELKDVLETELGRMRAEIQAQLSEARQLLLSRESESMARVAQLEAEVESLTRVCRQALYTEHLSNHVSANSGAVDGCGAARLSPPAVYEKQASSFSREKDCLSREPALSIQQSAAVEPSDVPDASAARPAIADLRGRLDDVFNFYTADSTTNVALLHPEMHLSHFTKLMNDVGHNGLLQRAPPHLLWMSIMRGLPAFSNRHHRARRTGSTLLQPPVYQDAENRAQRKDSFARIRLQTLAREHFGEALYIAFCAAALSHQQSRSTSPQHFRAFLVNDFLPAAEQHMCPQKPRQSSRPPVTLTSSGVSSAATSIETSVALSASSAQPQYPAAISFEETVARYAADDAVQHVLRQFAPKLKLSFRDAAAAAARCCSPHARASEDRMSLEAFVEYTRRHNLLPLLSKTQLKAVFLYCLTAQPQERVAKDDSCITYASFVSGMYCLAELVYGATTALQRQYPSPPARLTKLFVKMLVL